MERAINEADKAKAISVEQLHTELAAMPQRRRGAKALQKILDPATFTLTDWVAREPDYVENVLRTATELLAAAPGPGAPRPLPSRRARAACA